MIWNNDRGSARTLLSDPEIKRCPKRYIARDRFRLLEHLTIDNRLHWIRDGTVAFSHRPGMRLVS